jgi:hypothetical protein
MGRFFTRERFGRPQFLAGLLLLAFLAQCAWLVRSGSRRRQASMDEIYRLEQGLQLWGKRNSGWTAYVPLAEPHPEKEFESYPRLVIGEGYDPHHSPLWYLIASAPLLLWPGLVQPDMLPYVRWLTCVPYLMFGLLLGASLWYVARRLYGNAGGYIALTLYCFSPAIIRSSALWSAQPEMGAAWGAFGAVFTAIAVTHTLYAPREVVVWNWRRILLLGLSLALAVGCQFSLIVVLPVALGFMLYLAPTRRAAAIAIWTASCLVGFLLLFASYSFDIGAFLEGMRHATFLTMSWQAFGMPSAYGRVLAQLGNSSPALVLALPVALVTYMAWPRTRYFGNTAPLLIAGLFLVLSLGAPHYPGLGFQLMAVPFLFVFVAGVMADLLDTPYRNLVLACVCGLLTAYAIWNVAELVRVSRG